MLADILKQNDIDTSGMRFDYNARTILAFATLGVDGKRNERKFLFSRNPRDHMLLDESELDHNLIKKVPLISISVYKLWP
jgi:fructokinase